MVRLQISEQLRESKEEILKIMECRQEAEQQVNAAKVKMDVLSTVFKEKERELNRLLLTCIGHLYITCEKHAFY
jgi:hypothetical protein